MEDVGRACAENLLETGQALPSSPHPFDLQGPRSYSVTDVKEALEAVSGKKITVDAIKPDRLAEFYGQTVPTQYAQELAEMTVAMLPGGLVATEMEKEEGVVRGTTELIDVFRRIAAGETIKVPSGAF